MYSFPLDKNLSIKEYNTAMADKKLINKMSPKILVLLSIGHMMADINQGAIPALLPFLKESMGLSYTMAGVILLVSNFASSITQPLFGVIADKRSQGWLIPVGIFLASISFSLTGIAPGYITLLILVFFSGMGVAAFHPEGFRMAHYFTGKKQATGMSIFSVGGNFGFALGPMILAYVITFWHLKGTLFFSAIGIPATLLFMFAVPKLNEPIIKFKENEKLLPKKAPPTFKAWATLFLLILIVTMRSWTNMGVVTYIPFYYINYLHGNPLYAGKLVFVFLVSGTIGTLAGAPFADRFGHRTLLMGSFLFSTPLLFLLPRIQGNIIFLVIGIAGMILISSFSVTVVMAQTIIPQYLGLAAGFMVGFAIGTGGIGVTLLGKVADIWSVPVALKTIAFMPILGFLLALMLPYPPKRKS